MYTSLQRYSAILKLENEPFDALKADPNSLWWTLRLVTGMGLIAGLGKWLGLSRIMSKPTIAEMVNGVAITAQTIGDWAVQTGQSLTGLLETLFSGLLTGFGSFMSGDAYQFLLDVQAGLIALQPPLGARPSRLIWFLGDWLSTPFELLALWLGPALVVLVVARMLGGQGSLRQHLSLVGLAVAPLVLAVLSFAPRHLTVMSLAVGVYGKLLAVVAVAWAIAILLKGLAVAHDVSVARAAGILILTALLLGVVVPLATTAIIGFVLL